uniref:Uncharacterized protein n=1 Tax=viral metagenome TaxID=1070528 RepID=A0A6M3XDJ9_9ZZZZ
MKWIIVGFKHPDQKKSIIYKQNISSETLLKSIEEGIDLGCNIFSIRGFKEEEKYTDIGWLFMEGK